MTLKLYTSFHLNLAYSSIEEEQRTEVVRRCYWPLLRLARQHGLPFGIEAPAYTLEAAAAADPAWLDELRVLTSDGPCEFIGAGYTQIIAPLVPAQVNAANRRIGQRRYQELLGFKPTVGLVNEQAYAAGLLGGYADAGFEAMVMEWDNPAMAHPEWESEWRYLPQIALGQGGEKMPILWNNSLAFQKMQRYAHGEMDLEEYLEYLRGHDAPGRTRAFSLYGNDVEVFDFRPGRFRTEAVLEDGVEWERLGDLFEALIADDRFEFVAPSGVLGLMDEADAGNRLHLESAEQPVPVKKQGKYNLTRWAVTPRDDLAINTACWRIYERLRADALATEDDWRELCYLWSSDFRTHITEKRWAAYRDRLAAFENRRPAGTVALRPPGSAGSSGAADGVAVEREGRYVVAQSAGARLVLNTDRGLAIESLAFTSTGERPLVGTVPHGYYDDIGLGADFYTGHWVLEPPGVAKTTDLSRVEPEVHSGADGVEVSAAIETPLGPVRKCYLLKGERVEIVYEFGWAALPVGSFRLGHVTLLPDAFDRGSLFYACHNGGEKIERFALAGATVDQGRPVSSLVSASGGIGITGGVVLMGDRAIGVRVEIDKTCAALIGLVTYRDVRDTFFCRLALSALELDETSRLAEQVGAPSVVRVALAPYRPDPEDVSTR